MPRPGSRLETRHRGAPAAAAQPRTCRRPADPRRRQPQVLSAAAAAWTFDVRPATALPARAAFLDSSRSRVLRRGRKHGKSTAGSSSAAAAASVRGYRHAVAATPLSAAAVTSESFVTLADNTRRPLVDHDEATQVERYSVPPDSGMMPPTVTE